MALSGLEIYKLLPKTNCKKCGFPTCLAFAMQLAAKKVSLDKCPDITEEVKKSLEIRGCFILKGNFPNGSRYSVASGFCNSDAQPWDI